jgi:peptide deformylase
MILPVTVYGDPVLRKEAQPIDSNYKGLPELIDNMFETMYNADGVGLAAPQVGLSILLFVVDTSVIASEEEPELKDFKKVFINPEIIERPGEPIVMEEGCLSLPTIRENVSRPDSIVIRYYDEQWQQHTETYSGYRARVIQHEYDHLQGHLFVDYVSPIEKKAFKKQVMSITTGKTRADYLTRIRPDSIGSTVHLHVRQIN